MVHHNRRIGGRVLDSRTELRCGSDDRSVRQTNGVRWDSQADLEGCSQLRSDLQRQCPRRLSCPTNSAGQSCVDRTSNQNVSVVVPVLVRV